jgi:hypothetical protein
MVKKYGTGYEDQIAVITGRMLRLPMYDIDR